MDVASLETLRTVQNLSLGQRRTNDLEQLPTALPLRRLAFGVRLPEATLSGIERFTGLQPVELIGAASPDDVERLAALPQLATVTTTPGPVQDDDRWIEALQSTRPDIQVASTLTPAAEVA